MTEQRRYFHLLNAIRGIAAILVIGRHTALFQPINSPVSYMAVDIFFLLSGVVIEASYQDRLMSGMTPWRFIWIRIARLYPLYILGTGITAAALLLGGPHLNIGGAPLIISAPGLHLFFAMFLLPNQVFDPPAWSLFFELVVNIVYAFIVSGLTTRRLITTITLFGLTFLGNLVYFSHYHIVELGFQGPQTYFAGFTRAAFSFFLGVGLYRINKVTEMSYIRRHSTATTWAVLAGVISCLMAVPGKPHEVYFYIFCVFLLFPILVFVALPVESGNRTNSVCDFLGDISYAIYTLHVPILVFISSLLIVPYQRHSLIQKLIVRAVYTASLLTVAYAADKTYDKAARNFLRRLQWPSGPVSTDPNNVPALPPRKVIR